MKAKKVLRHVRGKCIRYGIAFLRALTPLLGRRFLLKMGEALGALMYFFSPRRIQKAQTRCAQLLGVSMSDASRILRSSHRNLGRSLLELLAVSRGRTLPRDIFRIDGKEYLDTALREGSGVILLSAHLGNWELIGAWMGKQGYEIHAIAARFDDPWLTSTLTQLREGFGLRTIWMHTFLREALKVLQRNAILAVLLDQAGGKHGCVAPFLGKPANTPQAPLRIAQKTQSMILPVLTVRDPRNPGHHIIRFYHPFRVKQGGKEEVQEAVERCNNLISQWIHEHPDQWLYQGWLYDRWNCNSSCNLPGSE